MGSKIELNEIFYLKKNSKSIRILCVLLLAALLVYWIFSSWQNYLYRKKQENDPYFHVTYRRSSLFLWQNPSFIRSNIGENGEYLPHFSAMHVNPKHADKFVAAGHDFFFRYHIWNRLLGESSLAQRPIYPKEFSLFLKENSEWLPKYWKKAPKEYSQLVKSLKNNTNEDLQKTLPFEVQFAFQGWKNYFKEWEKIENVHPKKGELAKFLIEQPHYNRSYWRTILVEEKPEYLQSFMYGPSVIIGSPDEEVSENELTSFVKIGFYNWKEANRTAQ